MFIRKLLDCPTFIAGDSTILREMLHPDKADLALRYSLAHAVVEPEKTSTRHRLAYSEVYYILEGTGIMHIDDEAEQIEAGDTVYIPPKTVQWIENAGDCNLVFLCIVDPAWQPEHEEVL